jgi:SHS2 domain-containing protein
MTHGLRSRPDQPDDGYEFIDHPGDLKLRAWGRNLEELFANAATGMMIFLFGSGLADAPPYRTETIEIEARDREALLVDWLSELLYRATSEYHAYLGFRMRELTETKLKATVTAVAAEAIEDIKAVTHHELSVRDREGGWEATIVFDT